MKLPRFIHKWYARLNGYFWLTCPICSKEFGGHEIIKTKTASLVIEQQVNKNGIIALEQLGKMCCPNPICNYLAGIINMKNGFIPYVPDATTKFIKEIKNAV